MQIIPAPPAIVLSASYSGPRGTNGWPELEFRSTGGCVCVSIHVSAGWFLLLDLGQFHIWEMCVSECSPESEGEAEPCLQHPSMRAPTAMSWRPAGSCLPEATLCCPLPSGSPAGVLRPRPPTLLCPSCSLPGPCGTLVWHLIGSQIFVELSPLFFLTSKQPSSYEGEN